MAHPVVAQELCLLEEVLRALEEEPVRDGAAEQSIVLELERVRALLLSGEEQKDRQTLLEQWDRGSALLRQLRASRATPTVDRSSPYFAHMRLREAGRERDVCLGRATCIRRGIRIVDWRNAPISRIFYRYRQGEPYEEELAGRLVEGEVVARRTVSVRAAALERIDAPEGSWVRRRASANRVPQENGPHEEWTRLEQPQPRLSGGAGTALRASGGVSTRARRLGTDPGGVEQRADRRLPEIAALLDPAQFDLITRPGSGCVIVRGSAGSGKTTVALHRIAYLAYDDPRIDSPEAIFLTLSPALCDYVSTLLPSLGVGRVKVETFPEWAARLRRWLFPGLPDTHSIDTPASVRRMKLHPGIGHVLEAQAARVPGPRTAEQALDDWASALTDFDLLSGTLTPAISPSELRAAVDWCKARHEEIFAGASGDEDEGEARTELDAEDDALLLRAWQLRIGPIPALESRAGREPLRYRHVAIDEAQDWSTVELRVVAECLGTPASLTLAGDSQQRIANPFAAGSWAQLALDLGLPSADVETLRMSYRSTKEIMEFGRGVLGPLWDEDDAATATRSGPPVEVFGFSDVGACVAFLADALRQLVQDEPLATVALLAPDAQQAAVYAEGLDAFEVPRLRRVGSGRFSFTPGIEIAEIEQAKGLEFDYVVLVAVSAASFPHSSHGRRLLHVGVTRAIHQLWVTHDGPASSLLAGLVP